MGGMSPQDKPFVAPVTFGLEQTVCQRSSRRLSLYLVSCSLCEFLATFLFGLLGGQRGSNLARNLGSCEGAELLDAARYLLEVGTG
jgi:hypothetical protein